MALAARMIFAVLLSFDMSGRAAATTERADVTPVQKVIQMLNDMRSKGVKEKEEETDRFRMYKIFCEKTAVDKQKAIEKSQGRIEKLEADMGNAEEETAALSKAIAGHNEDIAAWEEEKNEITALRAKEAADYQKIYDDYTSAMSEGSRVAATIKAGNTGASLVQLRDRLSSLQNSHAATPEGRRVLGVLLQESESDAQELMREAGAPDVKTYESHSFGALDIVEDMVENFEDKRAALEKEEMKKKAAFDLLRADLLDSIEGATSEREEKISRTQEIQAEKALAKEDHIRTNDEMKTDKQFLMDLRTECEQKSVDFEKRQVVRAGEIEAVGKAIEIMSGSAVSTGTKSLPGLAQTATAASSLSQLRSVSASPMQSKVAALLEERANRTQSRLLSLVAQRVGAEPFKKVVKMIEEMVNKLMTEANEEAEHKGFCDTEMGTNKVTRDQKSDEVDELTAQMEKATSDIKKLTSQIAELSDDIAETDASVAKLTAERGEEKAKNTQTIAEARVAAEATLKAITVLREFYASMSEAAALAQERSGVPGAPDTFKDGSSVTQGGAAGGVMGMLEVIESDFKRLDAETTASEMQAADDYKKFMTEASKDKAMKAADMTAKQNFKLQAESDELNAKKDLKNTKEELDAAMEYYEKLKPSCVEAGISYEERVAKRKEEIESLKEALQILNDSAPAF